MPRHRYRAREADQDPDEDYLPQGIERPDPARTLVEALVRLQVTQEAPPPEPSPARQADMRRAYQEQTTTRIVKTA